jgi:radical SAM superfamily enzyme YgiQ (UPF0313 family)
MQKILFIIKEEDPIDPMQIELLSALAKREGHETFLHVLQHGGLTRAVRRIGPDIVACTGKTGEHTTLLNVNRTIKQSLGDRVFTIMGGPHATFNHAGMQLYTESDEAFGRFRESLTELHSSLPYARMHHDLPPVQSWLDALCIGEGDDAWVELLRALDRRQPVDAIPNIVTAANRAARPLPDLRQRRTALDDLPFYDRELVWDATFLGSFPLRSFMVGRGCPFRCTYCFNRDWNRMYQASGAATKLRSRYSVDRLIAEVRHWMETEKKKGYARTQFIKFYDDIFELSATPWLVEFAEKFPREIGLPFACLMRCDTFAKGNPDGSLLENEELLILLKKAGMRSISMSIESGNAFVREKIFARDMTAREMTAAFAMMARHGVGTFANTILGVPAPVIPRCNDPLFDRKLSQALDQTKKAFALATRPGSGTNGSYPPRLEQIREQLINGSVDEPARQEAVRILESLDLHHDVVDYDIESVDFAVRMRVHQSQFPRLDPYPGTAVTDYAIQTGVFDGDFGKLHSSYLTSSSFNCFTPRQRKIQDRLSLLGQVCAIWQWLWPFARRRLIYWPLTHMYWLLFLLTKSYSISRYIYPMKYDIGTLVRAASRILLFEMKQFFRSRKNDVNGAES